MLNSGLVERRIGINKRVIVDTNSANKIYLDKKTLAKHGISSNTDLSQREILNILSEGESLPLFVSWELTDKCNFSCPFCYIKREGDHTKVVRFSESKSYIAGLIEQGLLYCLLTGGEPTIHPDFLEIYSFLKESGVIVELFSNGALFQKPEIMEILEKYPPFKIEVSIYGIEDAGFNAATHSEIPPTQVLNNILWLKNAGINVVAKTALTTATLDNVSKIREWCQENEIDHYFSTGMIKSIYGDDNSEKYAIDFSSTIKFDVQRIQESTSLEEILSEPTEKKKCFTCPAGKTTLHIDPFLNFKPCSYFRSNENKHNIRQLGLSESLEKIRDKIGSVSGQEILGCNGCYASFLCIMCPAKANEIVDEDMNVRYVVPEGHCDRTRRYFDEIMNNSLKS